MSATEVLGSIRKVTDELTDIEQKYLDLCERRRQLVITAARIPGVTQVKIAEEAGVSRQRIHDIIDPPTRRTRTAS